MLSCPRIGLRHRSSTDLRLEAHVTSQRSPCYPSEFGTALWNAVGPIVELFTPAECANYFKAAGYDPN
jgi:hypothetical protein